MGVYKVISITFNSSKHDDYFTDFQQNLTCLVGRGVRGEDRCIMYWLHYTNTLTFDHHDPSSVFPYWRTWKILPIKMKLLELFSSDLTILKHGNILWSIECQTNFQVSELSVVGRPRYFLFPSIQVSLTEKKIFHLKLSLSLAHSRV